MEQIKPWYASKTIWGAALSVVAGLTGTLVNADPVVELVTQVATVVGGAVAAYGRINADTKLK